jgi:hypothetical protein
MAKKKVTVEPKPGDIGTILVRGVDLYLWDRFKQLAKQQTPRAVLGSFLSETLRERIERERPRRST